MAEREIPCKSCEFPSSGRERELVKEEESMDEEEVVDSNNSDESDDAIIYDSDDSEFDIVDGPNADRKVWNQYYREWNESEGFDISVHPGASFMAPIVQLRSYLSCPKEKQIYTELCNLAIGIFNSQNAKNYEFVEIVKVNASFAAGTWFYFTFQARDTDDAVKIFQALVWDGIDGTRNVEFCRLKKFIK